MARLLLEVIHPRFTDDYHTWLYTGMALKFISDELLDLLHKYFFRRSDAQSGTTQTKPAYAG